MARGKRYTKEQYEEEFNIINPNFEIIGEFVSLKEKIRIKCKVCGEERYSEAKYNLRNHLKCKCNKDTPVSYQKKKRSISHQREKKPVLHQNPHKPDITHDEFIKRFKENNTHSDTLEFLEPFTKIKTPILTKCKVCNYVWKAHPSNLLFKNTNCRSCSSSANVSKRRYTTDSVKEKLYTLYPETTIQILEIIQKRNSNKEYPESYCVCKCGVCGEQWEVRPADLFRGHGCPHCYKANIVTNHEEFLKRFSENNEHKDDIEILSTYINSATKIRCRCKICNNEWETCPSTLYLNCGCRKCSAKLRGKKRQKPLSYFLEKLNQCSFKDNLKFEETEYVAMKTSMKFTCKIDGYEWSATPSQIIRSVYACQECARRELANQLKRTHDEFVSKLRDVNPYYDVLSEYISNQDKILVRCTLCKHEQWTRPNDLMNGKNCSNCSDGISYPNKFSYAFLKQLPIKNHIHEYSPKWANGKRYDNYFEYQGQGYILEMDGKQHFIDYKDTPFKKLEEQQANDELKNNMAIKQGIKVIRINCTNIYKTKIKDEILSSELAEIFDLSKIDWNECDIFARNNLTKSVWEYYNDNPLSVTSDIMNKFSLSKITVQRYLRQGSLLGVIKYSKKDIHARMKQRRILERNDVINDTTLG